MMSSAYMVCKHANGDCYAVQHCRPGSYSVPRHCCVQLHLQLRLGWAASTSVHARKVAHLREMLNVILLC